MTVLTPNRRSSQGTHVHFQVIGTFVQKLILCPQHVSSEMWDDNGIKSRKSSEDICLLQSCPQSGKSVNQPQLVNKSSIRKVEWDWVLKPLRNQFNVCIWFKVAIQQECAVTADLCSDWLGVHSNWSELLLYQLFNFLNLTPGSL